MEQKIMDTALERGAEFCDIRSQQKHGTSLEVKDGEIRKAVSGEEKGAIIRVLYNGVWGIYSTNRLGTTDLENALVQAIKLARAASRNAGEKITLAEVDPGRGEILWKPRKPPADHSIEEKYSVIRDMDRAIHEIPGILTVTTGYTDGTVRQRYCSSEGADVVTEVTRTVAQAVLIAREEGRIISFRTRVGKTAGFETFDLEDPVEVGVKGAESAIRILRAKASPSGTMPIIADPDLAGVFAHEALGHAAEADAIVGHESVLEGRLGETLGGSHVSIYDDPTIEHAFGSYPCDDEGVPTRRRWLIKKGMLNDYFMDRETAGRLGMQSNGAARAESYAVRPLVRMGNTMIDNGDHDFDELLEGIDLGIYARGTRGGQVDPAKGSFQFSAQEAFLIENGEITVPLRDVSLSGSILEVLKNIDACGNDRKLGSPGFCGKGQMVPVGDGGPHIRILDVTVGGGE